MSEFNIEHINGTAKVINSGKQYVTYVGFAEAAGYPDATTHIDNEAFEKYLSKIGDNSEGEYVTILARGRHETDMNDIYVVRNLRGGEFLIGEQGLTEIRCVTEEGNKEIVIPEMTYIDVVTPLGKEIRKAVTEAYRKGYEDGRRSQND